MILMKIDILDGRGSVEVVVHDSDDASRLRTFANHAEEAFIDQERWVKVRNLMTHERSGPNYGWTLGIVIPGDDQDTAIDEFVSEKGTK